MIKMKNIMRFIIWIVMLLGGGTFGIYMDHMHLRSLFYNPFFHIVTLLLGIPLLYFVLLVSRNTGRFLAKTGRDGNIPRMETNKLVTSSMYGCMRHPMHFGLLFFPLSIALIIGSPSFILVISPSEMLFILTMIKLVEEPEAMEKFGDDYIKYKSRVPMFNLRLSCIRRLFR